MIGARIIRFKGILNTLLKVVSGLLWAGGLLLVSNIFIQIIMWGLSGFIYAIYDSHLESGYDLSVTSHGIIRAVIMVISVLIHALLSFVGIGTVIALYPIICGNFSYVFLSIVGLLFILFIFYLLLEYILYRILLKLAY